MSGDNFVTVFAGASVEAGIVRALLESQGIAAWLEEEYIGTVAPWMSAAGGAGAVKVLVAQEHAAEARSILADHKGHA
jgi:hypothetical protein